MKTTRPILPQPSKAFKTDRLLLRPITVEDVAEFHVLRTQPEVMIHTSSGLPDKDIDATLKWTQRFYFPNDATAFCFAIEELSDPGKIIGTVGAHEADPPTTGYMFRKEHWGKGYATEALKAFLPQYWALDRREVDVTESMPEFTSSENGSKDIVRERLVAIVESRHAPSIKILSKCGFVPSGRVDEVDEDFRGPAKLVWYHLERPEA